MRRAVLIACAIGACTAPRDADRRDAGSPPGDGEPGLAEQCTPSLPGASAHDDDLDGSIDEGCGWSIGAPSPLALVHTSTAALVSPTLSGDKLRLYAVDTVQGALVVSTRPGRDRPFGAPREVARWEGSPIRSATISADEREVIVELEASSLSRATRPSTDAAFGALETITLNVAPPHFHPHLARDGRELFFVATPIDRTRVYRTVRAEPGAPFDPAIEVLADTGANELTPALAEDGRTLFVSLNGDLAAFERASRTSGFGAGTSLGVVPPGSVALYPFVGLPTRELFFVAATWPWTPIAGGSLVRAPICRDGACPDRSLPCEGGALSPDGQHCYVPFRVPLSWDAARADCEERGAHLATISSLEEHQAIVFLGGGVPQWVGATDRASECNLVDHPTGCAFSWIDGDPFVYAGWAADEPSGTDGTADEDCLACTGGVELADRDCAIELPYVCERERYLAW